MEWTIAFRPAAVFAVSNQPAYQVPGELSAGIATTTLTAG
jgi:hypothetical protein